MIDFALLPPEVNSLRMYTGPGATSLMESATAWQVVAESLSTAASLWSATISGLTSTWLGMAAISMATTASMYQAWLTQTAIQCEQTAAQAMAAVRAFETAYGATVPPTVVATNRTLLAQLVATNVLGINTPAIMATEADYLEMWAQDAEAMYQYLASSLETMILEPFTGPGAAADPASATVTPAAVGLGGIFAPGSNTSTTGLAGLLNLFSGSSNSAFGTFINSNYFSTALINSSFGSGFYFPSNSLLPLLSVLQGAAAISGNQDQTPGGPTPPDYPYVDPKGSSSPSVTPDYPYPGAANKIGLLSVPQGWTQPPGTQQTSLVTPIPQNGEDGEPGFPGVPGVPLGSSQKTGGSDAPKYGTRPTIMARPPSGG